jgi:hypothetical protein
MAVKLRRKFIPAALSLLCVVSCATGQTSVSTGAMIGAVADGPGDGSRVSAAPAVEIQPAAAAPVHAFWDRENLWLFAGVAFTRGMDYASTRNMQARGRKEILLAPEVVNNSAAFASLEAAGTMTSVGISFIFHRTGHHKLERWMSIGHIGVTSFGVVRNYCLKSRHTP